MHNRGHGVRPAAMSVTGGPRNVGDARAAPARRMTMPNNKNRDDETMDQRNPQGSQVEGDATGASNEDSDEEDRESREMQSTRGKASRGQKDASDRDDSREPQSSGSSDGKRNQVKVGNAD